MFLFTLRSLETCSIEAKNIQAACKLLKKKGPLKAGTREMVAEADAFIVPDSEVIRLTSRMGELREDLRIDLDVRRLLSHYERAGRKVVFIQLKRVS